MINDNSNTDSGSVQRSKENKNLLLQEDLPVSLNEALMKSPCIPNEVYSILPTVLKDTTDLFDSVREKDLFLTGAITALSGCFPNVRGYYDKQYVYPNIFSFIIAPPASGKGSFSFAKEICMGIHHHMSIPEVNYNVDPDHQPARRFLFLPGNISAAAMLSMLRDNNGSGVIIETEADTLTKSLQQEWGDFSDLLRKAFHHETFSSGRKKDDEHIEIEQPKLSIGLTGTPNQLKSLMHSIEDGLYSRFIFYIFRANPVWRDPWQKSESIYRSYITEIKEHIKENYLYMLQGNYSFELTNEQKERLNQIYSGHLKNVGTSLEEGLDGTIKRMALIHFKIAMTLSILRVFEDKSSQTTLVCSPYDFAIAEWLCETYLKHSVFVYRLISGNKIAGLNAGKIEKFYQALPSEPFQRKDALGIAAKLGISDRALTNYLRMLKEQQLLNQEESHGLYQKAS